MNEEELIKLLKDNLNVEVWCNYDGCDSAQVNVKISWGDITLSESCDYLPVVH